MTIAPRRERTRRAVPLDEGVLATVCQRVVDSLAEMSAALPPRPLDRFANRAVDLRVLDAPELRKVANVRGESLDVLLVAEIVHRPGARFVSGYATLRSRRSSWVEVHIQWNAAHVEETEELANVPGLHETRICGILRHELTHAFDVIRERDVAEPYRPNELRAPGLPGRAYFNSPHEVRAFMAQVLDEVSRPGAVREAKRRASVSRTPNKTFVETTLEKSSTWQRLAEEWTDENKKYVLKNVAQVLAPHLHAYAKPPLR